jgi:hypothetical protein
VHEVVGRFLNYRQFLRTMDEDMHPMMRVTIDDSEIKRVYNLTLTRQNFNYLCAGCLEMGSLYGRSPGGFEFHLFPAPAHTLPDSFSIMPDRQGYFAYIGAPIRCIPFNATPEVINRLSQESWDELEAMINKSDRIPITNHTPMGTAHYGDVLVRIVEDD